MEGEAEERQTPGSTARRIGRTLSLFLEVRGDWGVTEVSRELGCSKAVAFRILTALVQERILDRAPSTRRYVLGPALLKVRPFTRNQALVARQAWPYLDNITKRTGETAILSMLQGRRRIHVQQTPSLRETIQITVPIGVPDDLHRTASGLAMLAFMTADERWSAVGEARARVGDPVGIDPVDLHDQLATVRRRGYAVHKNEHAGTTGVAAPIRDQMGSVIGALSIIALNVDVAPNRLREYGGVVRDEANKFSRHHRA